MLASQGSKGRGADKLLSRRCHDHLNFVPLLRQLADKRSGFEASDPACDGNENFGLSFWHGIVAITLRVMFCSNITRRVMTT